MYVCICKAVRERQIREATRAGAVSLRDLTRTLGVGTGCGKCVPAARALLDEALLQLQACDNQNIPDRMSAEKRC